MTNFDPDYALFGAIAADIKSISAIDSGVITYANSSSINLYGDLRGKTILNILSQVAGSQKEGKKLIEQLETNHEITVEGKLNSLFVKYYSRLIKATDPQTNTKKLTVQASLMNMTESVLLQKLLSGTSEALKRAARAADEGTGYHMERINAYSKHLAILSGMKQAFVDDIYKYAQLHDIGKIKVVDLLKLPRELTEKEFEEVKRHTIYGAEILENLEGLEMAYNVALDHHEKWDGTGYPNAKRGEQISLEGRIVAIVDVFDALVSERPYKPALDYVTAYNILKKGGGNVLPEHFDPILHNLFLSNYDDFTNLHKELRNPGK